MTVQVLGYTAADAARWDAFCATAVNATLLHTRRFLSYHGDRLQDQSLLVLNEGRCVGLLPAARVPAEADVVASHPGATYGGLVHDGWLRGMRMVEAMQAIRAHYAGLGFRLLRYKPVPHIHAMQPAQDDLYALFRAGAACVRRDLACAIDLQRRRPVSERRRRALKKGRAACVVSGDLAQLPALWDVLYDNLRRRHDAAPVHALAELDLLAARFPREIGVRCAQLQGRVEAGIVLFKSPGAWKAQYIAASAAGHEACALDAVFDATIEEAAREGARYFDFGTSNEDGGWVLNDGLYRFKSEFGGGGVVHEHFELSLAEHGR